MATRRRPRRFRVLCRRTPSRPERPCNLWTWTTDVEFDWYIPATVVAAFTLLTTLKLTLTSRVTVGAEKKTVFFFHPLWLGALVVEVPFVIGKYLDGTISPWPVAAFQHSQEM